MAIGFIVRHHISVAVLCVAAQLTHCSVRSGAALRVGNAALRGGAAVRVGGDRCVYTPTHHLVS